MSDFVKAVLGAITGIFAGAAILFIGLIACAGYAWMSKNEVALPGVFRAWFTSENDLPALNFEPNGVGMLVVVLVITVLCVLSALRRSRKSPLQSVSR